MQTLSSKIKSILFGGGCFLCMEALFRQLHGVLRVTPGYCGGRVPEQVSKESPLNINHGHAQVILVEYEPGRVAYEDLVIIFLTTHDPTLYHQQGTDLGPQYRSIIFYRDAREKTILEILIQELQPFYTDPIVTEVRKIEPFQTAERCFQTFFDSHQRFGYCTSAFEPRLGLLRKQFGNKLGT